MTYLIYTTCMTYVIYHTSIIFIILIVTIIITQSTVTLSKKAKKERFSLFFFNVQMTFNTNFITLSIISPPLYQSFYHHQSFLYFIFIFTLLGVFTLFPFSCYFDFIFSDIYFVFIFCVFYILMFFIYN